MRSLTSEITLYIYKHSHAGSKVPHDVTMEEPNAGIVGSEAKHRVPATWNLHGIPKCSTR